MYAYDLSTANHVSENGYMFWLVSPLFLRGQNDRYHIDSMEFTRRSDKASCVPCGGWCSYVFWHLILPSHCEKRVWSSIPADDFYILHRPTQPMRAEAWHSSLCASATGNSFYRLNKTVRIKEWPNTVRDGEKFIYFLVAEFGNCRSVVRMRFVLIICGRDLDINSRRAQSLQINGLLLLNAYKLTSRWRNAGGAPSIIKLTPAARASVWIKTTVRSPYSIVRLTYLT